MIIYHNKADTNSYVLEKELSKITEIDQCNLFRYIVEFVGTAQGLNNFVCKVYPKCGEDVDRLLGILQRGEADKMRYIIEQYEP